MASILPVPYSGTVSAALEGAKMGVKSIALSAPQEADKDTVVRVFLRLFSQIDLEKDVRQTLNINVPALPFEEIKGVRWTNQGQAMWLGQYEERVSPMGKRYFWSTHEDGCQQETEENDRTLLLAGYVTLTPLTYEMTDRAGFSGKEFTL